MKKHFLILSSLFLASTAIGQVTNISGIINSYAAVTSVNCQSVNVSTIAGFSAGDRVILIQMKGAKIDSSNTPAFGTILSYGGAGNYEMATVASVSGNTISFIDSVLGNYNPAGAVQLVQVPVYGNVNVSGTLTCLAWNGATGGVLAFEADSVVTLNADIDVNGKGFRGGALSNGALVNCKGDTANYFLYSGSTSSAHKGEGIVNYNINRADGKGSNASGGGAGHDCNGGGAGGGNYGAGGHGGDSKCNVSCPAYFYQNSGGHEGKNLVYSNVTNKIFLGGGGGAGHQNNNGGTPGTNGGGIILIRTDSICGNNFFIRSDGINNVLVANIDGQGGGGAGGTILFEARRYSSLNVSVQGGYGGVDSFTGTDCHGKGGGGGGGILWTSAPIMSGVTKFLSGGSPGVFTSSGSLCYNGSNGAMAGQPGIAIIDLLIPESTAPCQSMAISLNGQRYLPRIYPNPSSGSVKIEIIPSMIGSPYEIFDNLGRVVLSGKLTTEVTQLDISRLSKGVYLLQVGNDVRYSQKLVKE